MLKMWWFDVIYRALKFIIKTIIQPDTHSP